MTGLQLFDSQKYLLYLVCLGLSFIVLNIEEPAGQITGQRLGGNSQALLIVKGDQKFNITNEGFLYAVSQPQKFTEVMKSKIDSLLIN